MHSNGQFPAHFVVHMLSSLHDLFCAKHPLHSTLGAREPSLGVCSLGLQGYRCVQAITMQGVGGIKKSFHIHNSC